MTKTTRFDAADYLDTEERQVAYIAAALESGDADFVRDALGLVARARGMAGIAKKAGLNRESLYKALGETGNPEFGTVMRIVHALGYPFSTPGGERTDAKAASGRVSGGILVSRGAIRHGLRTSLAPCASFLLDISCSIDLRSLKPQLSHRDRHHLPRRSDMPDALRTRTTSPIRPSCWFRELATEQRFSLDLGIGRLPRD